MAKAGDPDITSDFLVPANVSATNVDENFFTFTSIRGILGSSVTKASKAEFPALDGQSVSLAILQFPAGSVNPPHTHPRSAELLFVVQGTLEVGFVDTTNKLYTQSLHVGDMFVFPKRLVHFQHNSDYNSGATAMSAFGSANAGTASLSTTLLASGVDDSILAKSFKTDVATIQKIKAGLASNE